MVTASAGSGLLIPSESKNDRVKVAEKSQKIRRAQPLNFVL